MINSFITALVAICLTTGGIVSAQQNQETGQGALAAQIPMVKAESLEAKASLVMGYDLVSQYKSVGVALDVEALIQGIRLAAEGKEMPLSDEDCAAVVNAFNQQIDARRTAMAKQEIEKNMAAGQAFQKQYSEQHGIAALPSGVIHRVVQAGTGASPVIENFVKLHYTGKLVDGSVFQTSVGGDPAEFAVSGVVRGMTECLLRMKVGEKCDMVLPAETAWGAEGPPMIGPGQTVVFEVELLEILAKPSVPDGRE